LQISVILPVYNSHNTILRCIESVLAQTYSVHEILICNDGSTDNTFDIVNNIKSNKIRWLNCGRNGMPAIPRNNGVIKASGDYIAFLDSDDYWSPEKLEVQINMLRSNNDFAIASNAFRCFEEKIGPLYFKNRHFSISLNELFNENFIITSSVLIKRDLLIKCGLFPTGKKLIVGEDYALWLRIATLTKWIFYPEPLVYYSDIPNNSIRKFSSSQNVILFRVFFDYLNWSNFNKAGIVIFVFIKKILVNTFKI
jgi:teichuronic acid biosynthesis glycosyltransferase TuaG